VFENRLRHVAELNRMGADIVSKETMRSSGGADIVRRTGSGDGLTRFGSVGAGGAGSKGKDDDSRIASGSAINWRRNCFFELDYERQSQSSRCR